MAGRAIRIASRIIFFVCALVSFATAAAHAILRGAELPYQWEWVIFVTVPVLAGVVSLPAALLPRLWIANLCRTSRDDLRLFSLPLKLLGGFAVSFYLVALLAYFAPRRWDLDPQLMLTLCPMYVVKMSFDPPPATIFFQLAPMNAAVYGAVGLTLGYARLAFRRRPSK